MATTIRVPLTTTLADIDETIRRLLRRELTGRGFDGVEIAFDAPSRDWAAQLSAPTIDLFLYDVRRSEDHRPVEWEERIVDGRPVDARPPLRLAASYAVTAWTREVEDEHRLLSQLLAILYAFDTLPAELLAGDLADEIAQPFPLRTRVAEPRQAGGPEFWTSLGGSYKASLDYTVIASCDPGTTVGRGPAVRSHTLRLRDLNGSRAGVEEVHRVAGTVRDEAGEPVAGAWVVVEDGPGWAAADDEGRFTLGRMRAGAYVLAARAPDGRKGGAELRVPGGSADVVVGAPQRRGGARRRS